MKLARGIWHWLTSRTVRQAVDQHRIVRRLHAYQHDRLPPENAAEVQRALDDLRHALATAESLTAIHACSERLKSVATLRLDGLSRRLHRESLELVVMACVVVLAARTFFLQPMTIPSGSMQPTLYGITVENLQSSPDVAVPTGLSRLIEWLVHGRRYFHFVAKTDGQLTWIGPVEPAFPWLWFVPICHKQDFVVGGTRYRIWSPPPEVPNPFPSPQDRAIFAHARLDPNRHYRTGEDLMKLVCTAGDRVLVDRLTYNFRRPRRGEIIVFRTTGITNVQEGTYFMKRLVATGGERVRIGNDRHLVINGVRLDTDTPGFDQIYSFSGPPRDSRYSGHMNDATARRYRIRPGTVAPRFPSERTEFVVRRGHCLVMGDNTLTSLDGRRWGDFRAELVIGRFWMVYWPISVRTGWSAH
ncbi:MAG TPA: signal peptidase I [Verrucomicrobiota bacterium]|nr:signal peptidase I [Verrucomicrobiota bacterium]